MSREADPLADYRKEFAAVSALLAGTPDTAAREAAKPRIVALFKSIEREIGELAQIKEEIRGLVNRYKGLVAEAEARKPAVRHDHLGASTYVEKGWSLLSSGRAAEAIQALVRALELSPGDLRALALLGWAELNAGREEEALATFSRVLAKEPTHALARTNVGYLCLKRRAFGEAIEHLSRVIRQGNDPQASLYAHYYLGLVYLERGMLGDAQSFLARATVLGPNLIEAYHDLGRAQWMAGDRAAARATWIAGAGSGSGPWATRCQELLDRAARGEEVPRSASS